MNKKTFSWSTKNYTKMMRNGLYELNLWLLLYPPSPSLSPYLHLPPPLRLHHHNHLPLVPSFTMLLPPPTSPPHSSVATTTQKLQPLISWEKLTQGFGIFKHNNTNFSSLESNPKILKYSHQARLCTKNHYFHHHHHLPSLLPFTLTFPSTPSL